MIQTIRWQLAYLGQTILFALFGVYGISQSAQAQQIIHFAELISERDGLNDLVINDVVTDSRGVLWVATENGLNRLINNEFELFHEFSPTFQTAGHAPTCLFIDSKERLWVGDHLQGISVLNTQTGASHIIPNSGPNAVFEGREILEIKEAADSSIWVLTYPNTFLQFSPELKLLNELHYDGGKRDEFISLVASFDFIHAKEIIFTTEWNGVQRMDINTGTIQPVDWINRHIEIKGYVNLIKKLGPTKFFLEVGHGTYLLDYEKKQIEALKNPEFEMMMPTSCLAKPGGFFLVKYPYIQEYTLDGKRLSNYRIELPAELTYLKYNFKNAWMDNSSIIWLGSDQGVLKIDLKKQAFNIATTESFKTHERVSGNYIRYLKVNEKGKLLVSYVDEWFFDEIAIKYNTNNGFQLKVNPTKLFIHGKNKPPLALRVNAVFESKKWGVILGSYGGLLLRKPGSDYAEPFHTTSETNKQIDHAIWTIHETDEDNFLLGTRQFGLVNLNMATKTINDLEVKVVNAGWNNSTYIWDFYTDARGRTWILSSSGIFQILELDAKRISLKKVLEVKEYSVWSMSETKNGDLWIGTIEHGLFKLNAEGKFLKNLHYSSGLKSMTVCSVIVDDNDLIWLSAPNGLYVVNPTTDKVTHHFTHKDGLISEGFNYRSATKDHFGNLYFGTKHGIIYFNPKDILKPQKYTNYSSALYIRQLNEYEAFTGEIPSEEIEIGPDKRSLFIEPALSDYSMPSDNEYHYMLEGYDKEWVVLKSARPRIRYPNLPPGDYTLKIKGYNAYGNLSLNPISLHVSVEPFFYEALWFRTLAVIFILAIAAWMVSLQLKSSKNKRKLVESQLDSLKAQMNPHFFFNALNSIQDFIFHKDKEKAADFMSGFAKLLRAILQTSSRKYISLGEEEAILRQYLTLESLRFDGLFEWEINFEASLDKKETYIPTMLIQPVVENAIKHGLAPKKKDMKLTIRFYKKEKHLICEVEDNGIGRAASAKIESHESKGLWLIEKRLRLLNRNNGNQEPLEIIDLEDSNKKALGTRVLLTLNQIA